MKTSTKVWKAYNLWMVSQIQLVICENYTGRLISYFSVLGQSLLIDCGAISVDRGHLEDN